MDSIERIRRLTNEILIEIKLELYKQAAIKQCELSRLLVNIYENQVATRIGKSYPNLTAGSSLTKKKKDEDYNKLNEIKKSNKFAQFSKVKLKLVDAICAHLRYLNSTLDAYADVLDFNRLQDLKAIQQIHEHDFNSQNLGFARGRRKLIGKQSEIDELEAIYKRCTFLLRSAFIHKPSNEGTAIHDDDSNDDGNSPRLSSLWFEGKTLASLTKTQSSRLLDLQQDGISQAMNSADRLGFSSYELSNAFVQLNLMTSSSNEKETNGDELLMLLTAKWFQYFVINQVELSSNFMAYESRCVVLSALGIISIIVNAPRLGRLVRESLKYTGNFSYIASSGSESAAELLNSVKFRFAGGTFLSIKCFVSKVNGDIDGRHDFEQEYRVDDDYATRVPSNDDDDDEGDDDDYEEDDNYQRDVDDSNNVVADLAKSKALTLLRKAIDDDLLGRNKCFACGKQFARSLTLNSAQCYNCGEKVFVCSLSFNKIPFASIESIANVTGVSKLIFVSRMEWLRAMLKTVDFSKAQLLSQHRRVIGSGYLSGNGIEESSDGLDDTDDENDDDNSELGRNYRNETFDHSDKFERLTLHRSVASDRSKNSDKRQSQDKRKVRNNKYNSKRKQETADNDSSEATSSLSSSISSNTDSSSSDMIDTDSNDNIGELLLLENKKKKFDKNNATLQGNKNEYENELFIEKYVKQKLVEFWLYRKECNNNYSKQQQYLQQDDKTETLKMIEFSLNGNKNFKDNASGKHKQRHANNNNNDNDNQFLPVLVDDFCIGEQIVRRNATTNELAIVGKLNLFSNSKLTTNQVLKCNNRSEYNSSLFKGCGRMYLRKFVVAKLAATNKRESKLSTNNNDKSNNFDCDELLCPFCLMPLDEMRKLTS